MLGMGVGGGSVSGSVTASGTGTNNTIAKFTGASTLANSSITDNGTTVSTSEAVATGALSVTGTVTTTGVISNYNSIATAGQGVPPVVAATNLSGQGFAVFNTATPVTLVATGGGNAGTYRVTVYFVITTTFVTNTTEVITIGWTDDQGARTAAVTLTLAAGQNGTLTQPIRSTGAAAITYTPSVTGTAATAGAAAFSVIVERLV